MKQRDHLPLNGFSPSFKSNLEQHYGCTLSNAEVVEMKNRFNQFFKLLIEMDQKSKNKGEENNEDKK